jgi:hypothetical protein
MNTLHLSIAGSPVRVVSGEQALLDRLATRYTGFTADGPPPGPAAYTVDVRVDGESPPHEHVSPEAVFDGARIRFDLPGYCGFVDPDVAARLEIASSAPVRGVDYFLRVVLGVRAYVSGGLMLHAAGIVRDGRAYLFFGRSGSGKTTAARNAPGALVLNDDLVVLHPEAGRWIAYGTPFTNPSQTVPSAEKAPAAALLRLVQSPRVFIEPLTGARAMAELLACVPILNASPAPPLDRCRSILNDVPAFDLHLRPDPSYWELIDQLDR